MKQETLEEAAENFWLNDDTMSDNDRVCYVKGFTNGAKYQQEKLCDSEVIQRIRASKSDAEARRIIKTI